MGSLKEPAMEMTTGRSKGAVTLGVGPAGAGAGVMAVEPQPASHMAASNARQAHRRRPQEAGKRLAAAWHGFLGSVAGSVEIKRRPGLEAALQTYLEMVGGKVDPAQGIVIEP